VERRDDLGYHAEVRWKRPRVWHRTEGECPRSDRSQTKALTLYEADLLQLDVPDRERLLRVLADWLGSSAGVTMPAVESADLAWTLELRRLLLSPDEPHFMPLPVSLPDEDVDRYRMDDALHGEASQRQPN
jgi:hypothetical protein